MIVIDFFSEYPHRANKQFRFCLEAILDLGVLGETYHPLMLSVIALKGGAEHYSRIIGRVLLVDAVDPVRAAIVQLSTDMKLPIRRRPIAEIAGQCIGRFLRQSVTVQVVRIGAEPSDLGRQGRHGQRGQRLAIGRRRLYLPVFQTQCLVQRDDERRHYLPRLG